MAKENAQEEMQALAKIIDLPNSLLDHDPEVALAQTAKLAALSVDLMGFRALVTMPEHRHLLAKHGPNGKETQDEFIQRIWPKLSAEDRGAALDLGLGKMTTMGKIAETGIQVRVWRAFDRDEWQASPHCPDDFYAWVRLALTDSLDQHPESNKLANLCEAVAYLQYNGVEGVKLPKGIEDVFRTPLYDRFKTILPRLRALIKERNNVPGNELDDQIATLINTAKDPETKPDDLERIGRKKPPIPAIIIYEEPGKDPQTGCYTVGGDITEAQRTLLRQKMGNAMEYRLVGEQYDITDHVLVEYRTQALEFCAKCGEQDTRRGEHCAACGQFDEFTQHYLFSKRVHTEDDWGEWEDLDEKPKPDGYFDSTFADRDLGIEYTRFWEHA